MKRFNSILVVCDEKGDDANIIECAVDLAKANDAAITPVDTVDFHPGELSRMFGGLPGTIRNYEAEAAILAYHLERLGRLSEPIRAQGINCVQHVLQRIPLVEITKKVAKDEHDLVIKGSASEFGDPSFPNLDLQLMRKCPSPVWIMKNGQRPRCRNIVAAVDPRPDDIEREKLNDLVMELATSAAAIHGGDLHVVHAWKLNGEAALANRGFSKVSSLEFDLLLESRRRRSEAMLKRLTDRFPDAANRHKVHLIKGEAKDVIPRFVAGHGIDLVVMGTVGRSGVGGLILGNTSESILNQVSCSLLTVKPHGFQTPVQPHSMAVLPVPPGRQQAPQLQVSA